MIFCKSNFFSYPIKNYFLLKKASQLQYTEIIIYPIASLKNNPLIFYKKKLAFNIKKAYIYI
jgi:hypothetical protein